ncbi:hypothetical protein [Bremerella cremea]|uniref:hypothetical protein n=1 Tax=Bremerella cremea TaxID=1031537 RepID=UPI0031F13BCE
MISSSDDMFCLLLELRPGKGSLLDDGETKGAAVRCYVREFDVETAIVRVKEALKEQRLELVAVRWCVAIDEFDWEFPDDEDAQACITEAETEGSVVFSEFHAWIE